MSDTINATTSNTPLEPSVIIIRRLYDALLGAKYKIIAFVFVALVLANGLYVVQLGETAVKRRFGQLVKVDIQPGLNFRIPWGIEQVDRFMTEKIHRLNVQGHINDQLPILTGDMNFINTELTVQYRVTSLSDYLFSVEQPINILANIVRNELTDIVSTLFVDMVLSTDKSYVEEQIHTRAQMSADLTQLGIEIISVNINYIAPPADAIAAFRSVIDAKARKFEIIYNAKARMIQAIALARGDAEKLINSALAQSKQRRQKAFSDAKRFLALLEKKQQNPEQTQMTSYWNVARRVLERASIVVLAPNQVPNIEINLLRDRRIPASLAQIAPAGLAEIASAQTNEEAIRHLGQNLSHADEQPLDRKAGIGGHDADGEAHHEDKSSVTLDLGSHKIDETVNK